MADAEHVRPGIRKARPTELLGFANRGDEFCLVTFNASPSLLIPLTSDTGNIRAAILRSESSGYTALIDALYMALNKINKSKKSKKALVLISDSGENNSRYTPGDIKKLARESNVLIYSILMPPNLSAA